MAYSKERASKIEASESKFIPVGIQENVKLQSAKCETSMNGNTFLEIVFEKDGKTTPHTEWKPTMGVYTKTEEDLQKAEDKQFSRILQILHCFYKDEDLNFEGATFEEFAAWVADMLTKADHNKLLRVKFVYNKKGYVVLPNNSKFTFIEPMELPEGEVSKISITGYDLLQRPVTPDVEKPVDPLATQTSMTSPTEAKQALEAASQSDDLPF